MHDRKTFLNHIQDGFYEGERPLFALKNTMIANIGFGIGESALKHTEHVLAQQCEFSGKYPFWHGNYVEIKGSHFAIGGRAAIWYSTHLSMRDCVVEAPKMFRRVSHLLIENSQFLHAEETLWNCDHVVLSNVELNEADYVFMNGEDIEINNMKLQGNYSFQDGKNITIRNSYLNSKDAFWGTEHVTVYDSVLEGEYLGWHSKNLRLVNCTIKGEQPLYYAQGLVLENCRMEGTDLCFEYSVVDADIVNEIISVRNPKGGRIRAPHIGEIIIDEHSINPGACKIELTSQELLCG